MEVIGKDSKGQDYMGLAIWETFEWDEKGYSEQRWLWPDWKVLLKAASAYQKSEKRVWH